MRLCIASDAVRNKVEKNEIRGNVQRSVRSVGELDRPKCSQETDDSRDTNLASSLRCRCCTCNRNDRTWSTDCTACTASSVAFDSNGRESSGNVPPIHWQIYGKQCFHSDSFWAFRRVRWCSVPWSAGVRFCHGIYYACCAFGTEIGTWYLQPFPHRPPWFYQHLYAILRQSDHAISLEPSNRARRRFR